MNQLDATSEIISFVREQAPEEPRIKRALKVLEKRHAILLRRHQYRVATIADDIREEPLALTCSQIRSIYDGDACVSCYCLKAAQTAFCTECWAAVDAATRKAIRNARTFYHGFCRALRLLGCEPVQVTEGELAGSVYWKHQPRHLRLKGKTLAGLAPAAERLHPAVCTPLPPSAFALPT